MKLLPIKEQTWRFLRVFFMTSASRHITGRTLSKLILSSLKLFPVAVAAQLAGMFCLAGMFWSSEVSRFFLMFWFLCGLVQIWLSLRYVRSFWRDRDRVDRIRIWIRRWTALAVYAGIIWGVAGPAFLLPLSGISQVVTVAVVVAVTFASWPVYACWLPSLTTFTVLSLTPLVVAVAAQYRVSQLMIAIVILVSTIFILYSGRKLNELIVSAILTDAQNQRLVERLRVEISRAENARRTMQQESERRARFFAAANHDIRQPLQAMGIYLDILKRRATPQTAPVIEQLSITSSAISTLVEQVLTVTRMEFGQMELHPEHVSVPQLLKELADECRPIAEKKGLRLRVVSPPATLLTDVVSVKRALKNLVSNAIAYSEADAPVPEIVIGARRIGSKLTIGVYDCGPGISREDRERIFGTFYRGQAGKARPGSGFGLGLSIVRGIARQLAVKLSMSSHLGRGSVFRLTFNIDEAEQADKLEVPVPAGGEILPVTGTVLLLEDNRFVRDAMQSMLEGWGATVIASGEPGEAFYEEAEAAGNISVLVSDYNLGEDQPTGLEAGGVLEGRLGRPLPMVLLTAVAGDLIEAEYRRGRREGGAVPAALPLIQQKPADGRALNEAIIRVMPACASSCGNDGTSSEAEKAS
ncbi:MAG: hybrid sensor histidine kinase/response regulator [Sutterella sp.]|nr:hybrid sensor histidine kinase/response regulator [Sutterella sp.]